MASEEKYFLALDDYERRTLINALNEKRTEQLKAEQDTDAIDELLIKTIDAPKKRVKGRGYAGR